MGCGGKITISVKRRDREMTLTPKGNESITSENITSKRFVNIVFLTFFTLLIDRDHLRLEVTI